MKAANLQPGDRVLDLYSGVGLFAAFLAEYVTVTGRVDAVEGDPVAARLAHQNTADSPWVHHHNADVEQWLAAGKRPTADVVVLDPPRAGAGAAVIRHVVAREPRRIIYIACDAVSLARDARQLIASGYQLALVRAFDIFPMTKHVECVATFIRS
jgi:tRNA/tmRNA/rRNA uracil-C5-methylase (TrmA/RlmC/RlmD family)